MFYSASSVETAVFRERIPFYISNIEKKTSFSCTNVINILKGFTQYKEGEPSELLKQKLTQWVKMYAAAEPITSPGDAFQILKHSEGVIACDDETLLRLLRACSAGVYNLMDGEKTDFAELCKKSKFARILREAGSARPSTEAGPARPSTEAGSARPLGEQRPARHSTEAGSARHSTEAGSARPLREQRPARPSTEQGPARPSTEQGPARPSTEHGPARPSSPSSEISNVVTNQQIIATHNIFQILLDEQSRGKNGLAGVHWNLTLGSDNLQPASQKTDVVVNVNTGNDKDRGWCAGLCGISCCGILTTASVATVVSMLTAAYLWDRNPATIFESVKTAGSTFASGTRASGGSNNTQEKKQNAGDPNKSKWGEENEGLNNTEEQEYNPGGPRERRLCEEIPTPTLTSNSTSNSTSTSTPPKISPSRKPRNSISPDTIKIWDCWLDPDSECVNLQVQAVNEQVQEMFGMIKSVGKTVRYPIAASGFAATFMILFMTMMTNGSLRPFNPGQTASAGSRNCGTSSF
jgi:hypothetical protein